MAWPIIDKDEHEKASSAVSAALEKLDGLFSRYITALNSISTDGLLNGITGDALKAYAEQAASVKKAISVISLNHEQDSIDFLTSVDEADQEL